MEVKNRGCDLLLGRAQRTEKGERRKEKEESALRNAQCDGVHRGCECLTLVSLTFSLLSLSPSCTMGHVHAWVDGSCQACLQIEIDLRNRLACAVRTGLEKQACLALRPAKKQ
eukprot:scaffold1252_cov124-Isochrysis_galbana.AAC.9